MLSALQQRVARLVADLPEAQRFALVCGAALITSEVIERRTRNLDFFGPTADAVDALAATAALADAGLHVTRDTAKGHDHTFFVQLTRDVFAD
jgi:hypothetical protein